MRLQGARTAGVAVAIGAVVATGCGGEEGPSRDEFLQSANQICQRHTAPIEQAAGRLLAGGELPDPREFADLARGTIVPELTQQVSELGGLEPPADEELAEEYDQYLEAATAARERIAQDPSTLTDRQNFEQVNRQAQELGLSSCRIGPA